MIVITAETAIAYWRWRAARGDSLEWPLSRPQRAPLVRPDPLIARDFCDRFAEEDDSTIHLLVGKKMTNPRDPCIKIHCLSQELPGSSIVRIDGHLAVASPELALLQCATQLTRFDLIALMYELCGTYVINRNDARGFTPLGFDTSLTTISRLRAYLARCQGIHGAHLAQQAASYIAGGAASPRETDTCMLLTLPTRMGGYGIRKPLLNAVVQGKGSEVNSTQYAPRVDAYWPEIHLALEYESYDHHTGREKLVKDSRRRNYLKNLKCDVITVTDAELRSTLDMDRIAAYIGRRLGHRMPRRSRNHRIEQIKLRTHLFSDSYWMNR